MAVSPIPVDALNTPRSLQVDEHNVCNVCFLKKKKEKKKERSWWGKAAEEERDRIGEILIIG
jgi:hypothetical protein